MKRAGWTVALALAGAAVLVAVAERRGSGPTVLWWQGRAVRWSGQAGVVWAPEGELVRFDRRGRASRLSVALEGRQVVDATLGPGGAVWLVDGAGAVLRRSENATLEEVGRTPFDIPTLAFSGDALWAARSAVQFTFRPESTAEPLLARLSASLSLLGRADSVTVPTNPFFTQLSNAGHVLATEGGGVVFAPFIKDEVARYDAEGRLRWRVVRGLSHERADPRMFVEQGRVMVDYAPINLGMAMGPDGRLYVLSTPEASTAISRLDALDPETGRVLGTTRFDTALPTLGVDRRGRVVMLAADSLLPRAEAVAREAFPPFDLPDLSGGRLTLGRLRGKVTLVNFWASWCAPCREELPALDSLRRSFDTAQVAFVALSDDVSEAAARRFLERNPIGLLVGLGGGNLKARYHYVGLPFTVLLDGDGAVVRRWSGYTGPGQIAAIGSLIREELARSHGAAHRH